MARGVPPKTHVIGDGDGDDDGDGDGMVRIKYLEMAHINHHGMSVWLCGQGVVCESKDTIKAIMMVMFMVIAM